MRCATLLAIALFGAGCVYISNEALSVDDDFRTAAESWVGANIQEMIAVWPNPNMPCGSNTIGDSGCAWWSHYQNRTPGGSADHDYRCEAVVRYNAKGVITKVDVKASHRCERVYGENLKGMTRPAGNKPDVSIEDLGH